MWHSAQPCTEQAGRARAAPSCSLQPACCKSRHRFTDFKHIAATAPAAPACLDAAGALCNGLHGNRAWTGALPRHEVNRKPKGAGLIAHCSHFRGRMLLAWRLWGRVVCARSTSALSLPAYLPMHALSLSQAARKLLAHYRPPQAGQDLACDGVGNLPGRMAGAARAGQCMVGSAVERALARPGSP